MASSGNALVDIVDGIVRFFSQGTAEPGLMIVLAAATVLLQIVRRYRAAESGRTQVIEPVMFRSVTAAASEG